MNKIIVNLFKIVIIKEELPLQKNLENLLIQILIAENLFYHLDLKIN
jgi:hypothetical protein